MILWAGGWSALKILTLKVDMEIVTFWRFFIMLLFFTPLLKLLKLPIFFTITKEAFKFTLMASLLNIAFMLSAYMALFYGLAGSGGVIISTLSPILTYAIMATLQKRFTFSKYESIGLTLGLISGLMMLGFFNDPSSNFFNMSTLFYFFAALIWAVLTIVSQKSHSHLHPIHYSYMIAVISTVVMGIVLFIKGEMSDALMVFDQDLKFWLALLYLGILAQTIATTIFFVASQKLGSSKASSFMFLLPPFSLIISYLILEEVSELYVVFGGFLSIIAVLIIQKRAKA